MEGALVVKFINNIYEDNFNGFTFIFPSVSVGNVGQLTIDILLSSLEFKKAAVFYHPALLPIIGHDPYDRTSMNIMTAADLYVNETSKLVALQIRSMVSKVLKESFLTDLNTWLKSTGITDVIVLGSCQAHLRHDAQLSGSQFRYIVNDVNNSKDSELKSRGYMPLEEKKDEFGKKVKYDGSGFTSEFLVTCELPTVALIKFVDEGDNSRDAFTLADYLNNWTQYKPKDKPWKSPFSWKNLFGPPPPSSLF